MKLILHIFWFLHRSASVYVYRLCMCVCRCVCACARACLHVAVHMSVTQYNKCFSYNLILFCSGILYTYLGSKYFYTNVGRPHCHISTISPPYFADNS